MKIIAGIEGNRAPMLRLARELSAPVLVSANSLWSDRRQKFSGAWQKLAGLAVHLDSGGFVAMAKYGRYRFSVEAYAQLAAEMRPQWWAQMDLCCEPEIASDRAEVCRRIDATAANLRACQSEATRRGATQPLIVLQGWKPADYVSGPAFDDPAFNWPDVVGIGSVCRRDIHGADGLNAVVAKLDARLPGHVRFHLFGVKSQAAQLLRAHPRIASVDSMAHSSRARWIARETGESCNGELRARTMGEWIERQRARTDTSNETPDLFNPARE